MGGRRFSYDKERGCVIYWIKKVRKVFKRRENKKEMRSHLLNLPSLRTTAPSCVLDSIVISPVAPLSSFVPNPLLPNPPSQPQEHPSPSAPSVILFADASGFTKITNVLGPDDMSAVLTEFFSLMIVELRSHGFAILKFAGDALIAYCTAPSCAVDSLRCAMSLIKLLNNFSATPGEIE